MNISAPPWWHRWRARPAPLFETTWTDLWATVTPFWALLVAGQVTYYGVLRLEFSTNIQPVTSDALLGLFLLPLMVLGCSLILRTWRRVGLLSALLVALVSSIIFGCLARPIWVLATLIDPLTDLAGGWRDHIIPEARVEWVLWMSNIVEYLVLYLSCAAAAVGILSFRGLMNERLLRTRVEGRAAQERLRALRAQLNPHFLFNTLNSIVSLSGQHAQSAETLVSNLSDLLRRTLTASECEEHTLSEELAYAEAYLSVQRIRHPERVNWATHVAPGCAPLRVPSLILQPLIENAVTHGLRATPARLEIEIDASRADAELVLRVTNNCRASTAQETISGPGYGLRHVRERLAVLYGDRASLEVERPVADRFQARLRLPIGGIDPEILQLHGEETYARPHS